MTRKHVDEERCKICRGVFPDESDQIDAVFLREPESGEVKFIGYFCHLCIPLSAYLHPKQLVYTVDKVG